MASFITEKEGLESSALVDYYDYHDYKNDARSVEEASVYSAGGDEIEKILTGGRRSARPLSAVVNTLVDSAHYSHENRNLKHPKTPLYNMFAWRALESQQSSYKLSSSAPTLAPAPSPDFPLASSSNEVVEVECQYDAMYHEGDIEGKHGVQVRPAPGATLGPIAFLFRWYTKRNTNFASPPKPPELVDSPPIPPADLLASDYMGDVQRHLNRGPDPIMTLSELLDMLEDLDIVPQWLRRSDVARAFKCALALPMPANPNVLRPAGPLPDEVRYSQFCDILARLAVLVAYAAFGTPLPAASDCVLTFLELLHIHSRRLTVLKNYVDAITRVVKERGNKKKSLKWIYMAQQALWPELSKIEVVDGWKVGSTSFAPPALSATLLQYDCAAQVKYLPDWRCFPGPALHCGCMVVNELRCFRIVIRNRDKEQQHIRLDSSSAPFLSLTYSQRPLPSGIPCIVDVQVQPDSPGELCGSVDIYTCKKLGGKERVLQVPVYGMVGVDSRPVEVLSTINTMRRLRSCADPNSRPHSAAMLRSRNETELMQTARHVRPSTARSANRSSAAAIPVAVAASSARRELRASAPGSMFVDEGSRLGSSGGLPTAASVASLLVEKRASHEPKKPVKSRPSSALRSVDVHSLRSADVASVASLRPGVASRAASACSGPTNMNTTGRARESYNGGFNMSMDSSRPMSARPMSAHRRSSAGGGWGRSSAPSETSFLG